MPILISPSLILSFQYYLARNVSCEAPHFAVFSKLIVLQAKNEDYISLIRWIRGFLQFPAHNVGTFLLHCFKTGSPFCIHKQVIYETVTRDNSEVALHLATASFSVALFPEDILY
jgi:hypothetical protein